MTPPSQRPETEDNTPLRAPAGPARGARPRGYVR